MGLKILDGDELAVIIAEACTGTQRPEGVTAHEAMRRLESEDPVVAASFTRAAEAAVKYIAECNEADVEVKVVARPRDERPQ